MTELMGDVKRQVPGRGTFPPRFVCVIAGVSWAALL